MIDARCTLTPEGKCDFPRNAAREGQIVGESRDGHSWRVLWDGRTTGENLHKSYIIVKK